MFGQLQLKRDRRVPLAIFGGDPLRPGIETLDASQQSVVGS